MQKTQVAGLRVLRGPDWVQGEEDGGEGYLGTVIALLGDGQVQVLWDTGQESTCRAGQVGQHDLRVWDTATVGIRHTGTQCSECGCQDILGTLWRCQQCTGCDLCTLCYHDDKHDLGHPFSRLDTPGGQTYTQQKRKSSVKIRTIGLHPGAKVIRGKHWEWGDQDGGEGSEGEIQGYFKVKDSESARNLVTVQWSKGVSNSYRLGFDGKVDLKCVEEEVGPFYYRDHLLLLDTTKLSTGSIATPPQTAQNFSSGYVTAEEETATDVTSEAGTATDVTSGAGTTTPAYDSEEELPLAVGDRVAIKVGEDKLKEMQQEWGGCTARMIRCIGRTGEVTNVAVNGIVSVQFGEAKVSYRFNPHVLIKIAASFKVNDKVRLRPDGELQRVLNVRLGWTDHMDQALGKVGRVLHVEKENGDLRVDFNGCQLTFAPAACTPVDRDAVVDTLTIHRAAAAGDVGGGGGGGGGSGGEGQGGSDDGLLKDDDHMSMFRHLRGLVLGESKKGQGQSMISLFAAIEHDDDDTIRDLCQANPEMVNQEYQEITPLIFASLRGRRNCVLTLLSLGADVNRCGSNHRKTPLSAVLEGKSEEIAEVLLAHGADTSHQYRYGMTVAHLAVAREKYIVLKALAAHGADLNVKDVKGNTPLVLAIDLNKDRAVEILLGLPEVDMHATNKHDFDPIMYCCVKGNHRALELLLARDSSRVERLRKGHSSALRIAATNDQVECIRLLVFNGGSKLNAYGCDRQTALHQACHSGKLQAAEALLELGAELNIHDDRGNTPLHLSIGGPIEGYDKKTEKAEMDVAYRIQIATMLISRGAYVDAINNEGKNPFGYGVSEVRNGIKAFMKHNQDIVQWKSRREGDVLLQSMGVSLPAGKGRGQLKDALQGMTLPCGKCGKAQADVTLEPCRHKCVCSDCMNDVTKCPLCDGVVKGKVVGDVY